VGHVEVWAADGGGCPTPIVADVDGDGRQEVLIVGPTSTGGWGAKLLSPLGQPVWETAIPAHLALPGNFAGPGKPGFYLAALIRSKTDPGSNLQSMVVDARDGSILWCNDGSDARIWHHRMGPTPGLPTVGDVNGDGCDDALFVALELCTQLSGRDGSIVGEPLIANTIWHAVEAQGAAWTAYGTQIPVDLDGDGKLEILLAASWGQWGAWRLDRTPLWTVDPTLKYLPRRVAGTGSHPGIGDLDGDGKLEIGVLQDDGTLSCYEAATGALRWEVPGIRPYTDVVTADIDGDGKPEFLVGMTAIKAVAPNRGEVLWTLDIPIASGPIVADIDADGLCEIIITSPDGLIRVFDQAPQ
jgi:hypothetical protein